MCGSLGSLGSLALIDQFLTSKDANSIPIFFGTLGTLQRCATMSALLRVEDSTRRPFHPVPTTV
jgi:hypothetical protein